MAFQDNGSRFLSSDRVVVSIAQNIGPLVSQQGTYSIQ
jgi:hypothetical protein